MKLRLKIIILIILIMSVFVVPNAHAEPKIERRVIIFDEGHLQYYTHEYFLSAMSGLNDSFDTSSADYQFELIINDQNFNSSSLQGADLLFISNPGLNEEGSSNVKEEDTNAINAFVRNGGGIFYMSNPVTSNYTLSGHGLPYDTRSNENKFGLQATDFSAEILIPRYPADADNTSIIVDDFNNDGNITHVYIDSDSIKSDFLQNELNPISRILYYGSAVDVTNPEVYGNTTYQTYAVDNRFDIVRSELGETKWFSAQEIGSNNGRALLIGSTIMFTNTSYDESTNWIDVEDNKALFENIVAWLSNITPLDKPLETVDESFGSLFTKDLLVGILLSVGLIAGIFITLIRKHVLSPSNILDLKIQRKGSPKSSKTEKKEKSADLPTTKKPRSRRKRT